MKSRLNFQSRVMRTENSLPCSPWFFCLVPPALFLCAASAALTGFFFRLLFLGLLLFFRGATGTRFRSASAAGGANCTRFRSASAGLSATCTRFARASAALALLSAACAHQSRPGDQTADAEPGEKLLKLFFLHRLPLSSKRVKHPFSAPGI